MQIRLTKHLLILPALAAFYGCVQVKKNAVFIADGQITDSYGNVKVVTANDEVQLCVKASFVSDIGIAGSQTECVDVISDQNGNYSSSINLKIKDSQAEKTIDIKNAKIYGRKFSSTQDGYLYFTVNVVSSQINPNGGRFKANISVFSLD